MTHHDSVAARALTRPSALPGTCLRCAGSGRRPIRCCLRQRASMSWLPGIRRWAKTVVGLLATGDCPSRECGPRPSCRSTRRWPAGDLRGWRAPPSASPPYHDASTDTGDPTPFTHTLRCTWRHPLRKLLSDLSDAAIGLSAPAQETSPGTNFLCGKAKDWSYQSHSGHAPLPRFISLRVPKRV